VKSVQVPQGLQEMGVLEVKETIFQMPAVEREKDQNIHYRTHKARMIVHRDHQNET